MINKRIPTGPIHLHLLSLRDVIAAAPAMKAMWWSLALLPLQCVVTVSWSLGNGPVIAEGIDYSCSVSRARPQSQNKESYNIESSNILIYDMGLGILPNGSAFAASPMSDHADTIPFGKS